MSQMNAGSQQAHGINGRTGGDNWFYVSILYTFIVYRPDNTKEFFNGISTIKFAGF